MTTEIRVVIADDHPIFRQGLRELLAKDASIKLLAEAEDGEEALSLIRQHRPDIALLDIDMSAPNDGFEIARRLAKSNLAVKLIYLTGLSNSSVLLHEALQLGATGFLVKTSSSEEIIQAIKTVAAGKRYVSGVLSDRLLEPRDRAAELERQCPGMRALTATERRILRLLAQAKTGKEIAAELGISPRTAENHLASIRYKLDLTGYHQLMKFAIEHREDLP
jgi:DNA-binding NarL/FixJ family response regulator